MTTAASATPLVAIGVPVYNSERYLCQSIDSLLNQTFRDFVLIICDNASTDGTAEICKRYASQDPRVKYVRNSVNIGLSGNFNRVFELSNAKYFKWSTADDYWAPDMLKDALAVMEADDSVVLCYPKAVLIDADGNELERYEDKLHRMEPDPAVRFLAVIHNLRLVHHHLGLLRSAAIRKTHLFGRHVAADVGFLAELSLYGKFCEVPKFQFFRRFHEDSSSWKRGNEAHEARRFYAANVRKIPFNAWRFHWTYVSAVLRSPLGLIAKAKLVGYLVRQMYWDRQSLCADLRSALTGS